MVWDDYAGGGGGRKEEEGEEKEEEEEEGTYKDLLHDVCKHKPEFFSNIVYKNNLDEAKLIVSVLSSFNCFKTPTF